MAMPPTACPALRVYDLATGTERWGFAATGSGDLAKPVGDGTAATPVIAGDIDLFGVSVRRQSVGAAEDAHGLYAVATTTGALLWHAAGLEPTRSAPAVLGGTIYMMDGQRPRDDASGCSLIAFAAA
jgi:outer membrane protein assembly factor BamB